MEHKIYVDTGYSPVQWVYREVIEEEIAGNTSGKIFHFCPKEFLCTSEGRIIKMEEVIGQGLFIELDSHVRIRIDRIVTLFGKPGPAFDEYDSYGNACLDCTGGYDIDRLP